MSMKVLLDPSDRVILRALQKNAGATLETLSEQTGISPASAWRRVKSLEASGVISAKVALLDPSKVARNLCVFAEVSLNDNAAATRDAFEAHIETLTEVMECHQISGRSGYLVKIRAEDISAYQELLSEALLSHGAVASVASTFSLRETKYQTALPI